MLPDPSSSRRRFSREKMLLAAADASVLLCSGTMETMMREQARKGQWRPELPHSQGWMDATKFSVFLGTLNTEGTEGGRERENKKGAQH
jgi:hypothetical protein